MLAVLFSRCLSAARSFFCFITESSRGGRLVAVLTRAVCSARSVVSKSIYEAKHFRTFYYCDDHRGCAGVRGEFAHCAGSYDSSGAGATGAREQSGVEILCCRNCRGDGNAENGRNDSESGAEYTGWLQECAG